jgi:tetraacyldisaccharide 4'-kinase
VLPADFSEKNFPMHDVTIESLARQGKLIWRMKRELVAPAAPPAPVVFCGIARPHQFFAQVRAAGIAPAAEVVFRDHHRYDRGDTERLLAMHGKLGAGGFLTTEKDEANLGSLQAELQPLAVAALSLAMNHPTEIVDAILARTIFAN